MVSSGRTIAFINANRLLPDEAAQLEKLKTSVDLVICSSKEGYQQALTELNATILPGDTLAFVSSQVFEVSIPVLLKMLSDLLDQNISIRILDPGIHLTADSLNEPAGRLFKSMLDHSIYYHRLKTQKAAAARPRSGPQPKLSASQFTSIEAMLAAPGANATSVAKNLNVSRATLFNFLRKHRRTKLMVRESQ